jgi:outer membrane murein-binding lipoprotein Lpp
MSHKRLLIALAALAVGGIAALLCVNRAKPTQISTVPATKPAVVADGSSARELDLLTRQIALLRNELEQQIEVRLAEFDGSERRWPSELQIRSEELRSRVTDLACSQAYLVESLAQMAADFEAKPLSTWYRARLVDAQLEEVVRGRQEIEELASMLCKFSEKIEEFPTLKAKEKRLLLAIANYQARADRLRSAK